MKKSYFLNLLAMRLILLTAFILLLSVVVQAQNVTVRGVVTNSSTGETLPGVNVLQQGTVNGTSTGVDGAFSLTVPQGSTLIFSFIGMKTQEVGVGSSTVINVTMEEEATALEEVVVTGYSTERKVDLTGAVAVVDVGKVNDIPKANPMATLQGRVPGLFVEMTGRPSGETRQVLIRGLKTLGNNDPLYIIDGVPTKRGVV